MKRTNVEPQLIPLKDLIKQWEIFKKWFKSFKQIK